jgi:hypothetical protein
VRSFVRGSLGHRFAATATATEARAIEARSNGATGLTGHRC